MKKNKKIIIGLLAIALIGVLGWVSTHPLVSKKCEIPEECASAIYAQSLGLYLNHLPLLPICISIESFSKGQAHYTIHYFPLGTVEMSYSMTDDFNQEKSLKNY